MLRQSQLDALDSAGYLVIPSALDASQLMELRRAFDAAPQTRGTQHVSVTDETPRVAT